MQPKSFISDASALVDGMCRAVVAQRPHLKFDQQNKVVFRARNDGEPSRVRLISGGGSGHEPAHAGYVGEGMLDAAVCGAVFASPNVGQIIRGLQHIQNPAGVLAIVKNYTGDKLNFGLAVEEFKARARTPVEIVLVADDVAVPRSRGVKVGRRGLAGTVLVHKIAGAASAQGLSLQEVTRIAQEVSDNLATIGVSLDHCVVPGQADTHSLRADEIELGMGIHNEPGVETLSPQPDLATLVDRMLAYIFDKNDQERAFVDFGIGLSQSHIVLLINNLGGLSVLEINAISHIVLERLYTFYNIRPTRLYVGTYLTSLNGPGFSITALHLTPSRKDKILQLLDEPNTVAAWTATAGQSQMGSISSSEDVISYSDAPSMAPAVVIPGDVSFLAQVLESIQNVVKAREPEITKFDTLMGDGDCGTTLLAGIDAVAKDIRVSRHADLATAFLAIASVARDAMGGTSGALYGLFLGGLAGALQEQFAERHALDLKAFAIASKRALQVLEKFTAAREGSRTLMDATIPFVKSLQDSMDLDVSVFTALSQAVEAAKKGAEGTKVMVSSFGRSTYVGAQGHGSDVQSSDPTRGIPDPGACGVVAVLEGILAAFGEKE